MFDDDVISLAHGEGLRRPHESVIRAAVLALLDTEHSLENYLFLRPFPPLEEQISEWFIDGGIVDATARDLCIDAGSTRLCVAFLHAATRPGDVVLAPRTFYHPLASWCDFANVRLECVPTEVSADYKFTRPVLEAWYDEHVFHRGLPAPRALFLFSPSMSGAVYTASELESLGAFAEQHDLWVLEDAIFRGTEFNGKSRPPFLAALDGMNARTMTVGGASKLHSLANMRVGWACGPAEVMDRVRDYSVATSASIPHVAKAMALAALTAPQSFTSTNVAECQQRCALITEWVTTMEYAADGRIGSASAPAIAIDHQPAAGHSVLLVFEGLRGASTPSGNVINDSIDLTRYFLESARVALSPGFSSGFDDCHARASFACVGAEATHSVFRRAERAAVFSALGHGTSDTPVDSVEDELRSSFAVGRRLLQEAFLRRLLPATLRLRRSDESAERLPMGPQGVHRATSAVAPS